MRDIVVHQAGNAEELARVLGGHLAGEPVATRGFEEREGPLRALNDADLWDALLDRMAALGDVAEAAEGVPADTDVAWTGRTMKVPWFAEHMREELVLHSWDITGDEPAAQARLAEPWMTTHSVLAVGKPLLAKGARQLEAGERIDARLRAEGTDDTEMTIGLVCVPFPPCLHQCCIGFTAVSLALCGHTQVKALIDAGGGDPSEVNEDLLVKYWTAEYRDGKQRLGHGRLGHGSIAYAIIPPSFILFNYL